ncbi:MAG: polyprenyl diphosphate synthase [Legionella sp.]|nr:polyprenyl diphosphate synthase [Legionella sp.]
MKQKTPQHVAIVMDGNGRWAEAQGLPRVAGHRAGVEAIRNIVEACPEKNISVLSVFAFGQDNWARPEKEVNFLMALFLESLQREITELHEKGVRLRVIGERQGLDDALKTLIQSVESLTENNQTLHLNIMMNYSGRWDIMQATRQLAHQVQSGEVQPDDIDEALFSGMLSTAAFPEPDMLIRTSGELRISNFFLWQLAYAELYFTPVAWPEFTKAEFDKALDWFASRERRYGKTSQQIVEE